MGSSGASRRKDAAIPSRTSVPATPGALFARASQTTITPHPRFAPRDRRRVVRHPPQPTALAALVLVCWRTLLRIRVVDDPRPALKAAGRRYVYAILHAHQLSFILLSDDCRVTTMKACIWPVSGGLSSRSAGAARWHLSKATRPMGIDSAARSPRLDSVTRCLGRGWGTVRAQSGVSKILPTPRNTRAALPAGTVCNATASSGT